ncbi:MAG: c-type cytochrome [Bacteroidia bacterium]
MELNTKKNRIVLFSIISVFTIYNIVIYTQSSMSVAEPMSEEAILGEQLWQKSNCTACHQLYGLGGYLGPDLTNVISNPNKGADYVKAFINSAPKSMPKYNFTDKEKDNIVAFLESVDKTGIYPNKNAVIKKTGWVEMEYKK